MVDTPDPASATPVRAASLDGFLLLQGLVVVVLGVLALAFVEASDPHDAALVATGLIGALAMRRKTSDQ